VGVVLTQRLDQRRMEPQIPGYYNLIVIVLKLPNTTERSSQSHAPLDSIASFSIIALLHSPTVSVDRSYSLL